VRHGHFTVNGRKVDIPSFLVKAGDEVGVRERSRKLPVVMTSLEQRKGQWVPEWLELSTEKMAGRVLNIPTRQSITVPINEQLIVELYSK
jgi:small subunit ribosomal protein S4